MKYIIYLLLVFLLSACNENINNKTYNGKELLKEKCASCHNLDLPASWEKPNLAPPIMAVSFHVYDLVDKNIATKLSSSKTFIIDYVLNPDSKKSLCDKESLKQYGLMPSQKENITKKELEAIATYILKFYTQKNLYKIQEEIKYFNSLKAGHKIAIKYKCLSCHKINKNLVGPSFKNISNNLTIKNIKNSITNGSKSKWKDYHNAVMPSFKDINHSQLEDISKWIKNDI